MLKLNYDKIKDEFAAHFGMEKGTGKEQRLYLLSF